MMRFLPKVTSTIAKAASKRGLADWRNLTVDQARAEAAFAKKAFQEFAKNNRQWSRVSNKEATEENVTLYANKDYKIEYGNFPEEGFYVIKDRGTDKKLFELDYLPKQELGLEESVIKPKPKAF